MVARITRILLVLTLLALAPLARPAAASSSTLPLSASPTVTGTTPASSTATAATAVTPVAATILPPMTVTSPSPTAHAPRAASIPVTANGPLVAVAGGLVTQDLTTGLTATTLARTLVGTGVTVSNVTYTGANVAAGTFSGGTGTIGFESGIILSTGTISTVVGPNTTTSAGTNNGQAGDAQLTTLSGRPTFDAAVLQFDFVPVANTVSFQYVFSSEEYNEYVNRTYNDVFAFYINGVNCATVGNPPIPVAVDTINNGNPVGTTPNSHPELYINNDFHPTAPLNTQMDGLTVSLTCQAAVTVGVTNHVKLAIADATDAVYDSDVFLKASSFTSVGTGQAPPIGGPLGGRYTLGGRNYCAPCVDAAQGTRATYPVNTATGNFWHTFSDIAIPGRGLPLAFSHTYNSLMAGTDGPLGFGWTFSNAMALTKDLSTGAITVTQETGSQVTFALSGTTYTAPPRVTATLVKNGDGTFTLTRGAQNTFTFSATGQLIKEQDRNGYATTLTYNGTGQLAAITDPAGRALTLAYSGTHLTSVTDPTGRKVLFGYTDGLGNLTDVTDVAGGGTHFTYDPASHLLLTMRDPRGGVVTTHYDASNRVDWQTDPLSRKTSFAYTVDNTGVQTTTITDPKGNVVVEQYQYGLRLAVTNGYGTPAAATWQYRYDPATLGITTITDPNTHVTTMT